MSAPSASAPSGAVAVATKAGILRCQAPNIYRIDNNSQRRVRASAPFGPSIEPNRHMPLTPPSTHQCTHINHGSTSPRRRTRCWAWWRTAGRSTTASTFSGGRRES